MPHKDDLIKLSIEKSNLAVKAAKDNIELENFEAAQNRVYYAIFYIVTALAYKNNFITAKHNQLMGWFNKKFIYEEKVFGGNMVDIYKEAYSNRQKSDYDFTYVVEKEALEDSLKETEFFIKSIKNFIA